MQSHLVEAARAMSNQSYEQAAAMATRHLASSPGDFDGLHLLGIALCHCGKVDEGRRNVEKAISLRPKHPDPYYNLGTTLLQLQEWDSAKHYLNQAITLAPGHYSAWNSLGLIHMHEGNPAEAAGAYRKAVRLNPDFAGAWRNLASALTERNEKREGIRALREALRLEPGHQGAMEALGSLLVEEGRVSEARELLERALRSGAKTAELLQTLGILCIQLTDYETARTHLSEALRLKPDLHTARDELGVALSNLGRPAEARSCHEAVLEAQPSHARAWGHLAELLEMTNNPKEAEELADRGLVAFPRHPVLTLVKAKCERRLRRTDRALKRLQHLKADSAAEAPYLRAVHFELGRCHDARNEPAEAMREFSEGNRRALMAWQAGGGRNDPVLPAAQYLRQQFKRSHQPVQQQPAVSPAAQLAFVVGFQRSGTTLLDTILDTHSQVQVVEESPALMNTASGFARSYAYPQGMANLTEAALSQLRRTYLQAIEADAALDGDKLVVDKSPLNFIHLGLIRALFPDAPIILLVRDPRDVCLSCFIQDFELSPFTARLCSLEETAQAYAALMSLQLHYEKVLALNLLRVRYEDLVLDFDGQVRRVLQHVALNWEPGLSRFYDHAKERGLVRTPSYHQVSQPIYGSSVGRWRSYAHHIRPLEPLLAPFVEHFGYAH